MSNNQLLLARVQSINLANATAMEWYDKLAPIFEPWVGQPILKTHGGLLMKVEKRLPDLPYLAPGPHIYRDVSDYVLRYSVKVCMCVGGIGHYHEASFNIGELAGAVLREMLPCPKYRTDYTVEEIIAKREAYKAAKRVADEALNALHPFGEYDR